MDMLKVHDEALAAVNEAHHRFLLRYRPHDKIVYGLVEGKDDPMFYRSAIERFLPEDWTVKLIPAGGKQKVLEVFRSLDWHSFSALQVAFFTDRDLSLIAETGSLNAPNIYVTDGYSIENSIVTAEVFFRLLQEAYNVIDITPTEKDEILKLFDNNMRTFQYFLTPLMAQISGWRKKQAKANLDNLNLTPLFNFDRGRLTIVDKYQCEKHRIEHLCACVGASKYAQEEIDALKAEFLAINGPEKFVRGKYLVWFLAKAVVKTHEGICSFVSAYQYPPKIRNQVGPENVMVNAAPRARTPPSLKKFLEMTYLAHIKIVTERAKAV